MEIARAWLGNGDVSFPQEVAAILSAHAEFGAVLSWQAEPEARLHFDNFPGEPRNSDLLVVAEDNFAPYLLAVEGKADEPYGETVGKALVNAANGCVRIRVQMAGQGWSNWRLHDCRWTSGQRF